MAPLQQKSTQASTYASASSGDEIVLGCHCGIVASCVLMWYMYLIEFTLCKGIGSYVIVQQTVYSISVNQCCSALNHIRSATFDFTWRTPSTFHHHPLQTHRSRAY